MISENIRGVSIRQRVRNELGIPQNAFLLLSVGELNQNKNHRVVIEALAKLRKENVYYLICGEGTLRGEYEQLSEKLGLSKKVVFAGYRNDIEDIYKAADLFVFPSRREGLPVALMEAMASGLPILCSDIRGNRDLAGREQLLENINDSDYVARHIEECVNKGIDVVNRIDREKLAAFSLDEVNNQLEDIYRQII